jgi:uncharacterized metal-binding protein
MPVAASAAAYVAGVLGEQAGLQDSLRAGLACALGVTATLAINPDLDLLQSSFSSKLRNKPLFIPWWLLWYLYSAAIPHRHPYSHFPILGTLIRIAYLLFFITIALAVLVTAELITPEQIFNNFYPWFARWFILGMVISDTLHWFMDTTRSTANQILDTT